MRSRMLLMLGMAGAALMVLGGSPRAHAAPADYPTEALADYVFGCMAANGGTQDALQRCSCSIDHVAAKLSYNDYVQAETVLRMQRVPGGDRAGMFKGSPWATKMVDKLRQAQSQAETACF